MSTTPALALFSLEGQVAVITGGTGTLGSCMAKGLAEAGANVFVLGRNAESGARVVADIQQNGGKATFMACDVLVEASLRTVNKEVLAAAGKVDILVNCAGGNVGAATIGPDQSFFKMPPVAMQQVFDLNIIGTVLPSQIFGESMQAGGKGNIINISSMTAQSAVTRVCGYSAAKAAVDNFTKWLAVELATKYGESFRVNAISPGFFIAEQNRKLLTNEDGSFTSRGNTIISNTPMKRFGKPEELLGALLYLASDASSFVTGTVVAVDGGFSAFSGV